MAKERQVSCTWGSQEVFTEVVTFPWLFWEEWAFTRQKREVKGSLDRRWDIGDMEAKR